MYTEAELYAGSTKRAKYNKKGKLVGYEHIPLDPAMKEASMRFHYPPPPPSTPKPAQQTTATLAAAGDTVRRPDKKRKKTSLASLRIRPKSKINQQLGGMGGGSGLNIGGFA